MKFCKECGNQLSHTATFCKECGTPVNGEKSSQPATSVQTDIPEQTTAPVQPAVPRKPMSKKTKIMLISGIAAVILLFGAHKIVESLMSKERLIEKFETALHEKDAAALADILTSNDKKLDINKNTVKGFIAYFEENPNEEQEIIAALEAQAKAYDQTKEENPNLLDELFEEFLTYSPVTLEQDGKFLFYEKYEININGVYLTIETNYKDTLLSLDGEELATTTEPNYSGIFGPFVPGIHTLKGTLKTDFVDLKEEKEIFLDGYGTEQSVGLYLDAEEVTVYLPDAEYLTGKAKLFINGKDVGVNVLENQTFGPVLTDGSMTVQVEAEFPWGKVKTKEVPIDDDHIELSYDLEDVKTTAMNTVHKYVAEYVKVMTSADESVLTTVTSNMKEELVSRANGMKEDEIIIKAEYLGTDFDLDSFYLEFDDTWKLRLSAQSKLNETSYYADEEETEMEETTWHQIYYLSYVPDQSKWLIYAHDDSWYSFNDENTKHVK